MKFQKLSAFEKHFRDSLAHHLSPIYLVVCSRESERKTILSSLATPIRTRADFLACTQIDRAIEHLNSGSLLSEATAALFDGIDHLRKEEMEHLSTYCQRPNTQSCLLLGSVQGKGVTPLYQLCKSDMVVLDLLKEKSWDEKDRFLQWICRMVRLSKKEISAETAAGLLERFPRDRLLLKQEIDKLLCFVGDRKRVTLADVNAICGRDCEQSPYQLARAIVWERAHGLSISTDPAFVLPLIAAIRSQLEIGLKLCSLQRKGASEAEVKMAFPHLFPKSLQRCQRGASQQGSGWFEKGLIALFDFEFGVKTSKAPIDIVFTLFLNALDDARP